MNREIEQGAIRRVSTGEELRPLSLEVVAPSRSGEEAVTAQMPVLPGHGLISRERLRLLYAEELAVLAEEARRSGYEAGMHAAQSALAESAAREAETRRSLEEHAESALAEKFRQLEQVTASLATQRITLLQDAEATVIELAYACLVRLLGDMVEQRGTIQALVSTALEQAAGSEALTVRLSLGDHAHLDESGALQQLARGRQVDFKVDPNLRTGACRVESARGTLDAGLESQLAELKRVLAEVHRRREEGGYAR